MPAQQGERVQSRGAGTGHANCRSSESRDAPRDLLIEHRQITRCGTGLIVGATSDRPFTASAVRRRALTDWSTAGLKPLALHECRHTFASLMIAAGVNAKALTTFLGHASIETTFDLYGKLMPGGEAEAAARGTPRVATRIRAARGRRHSYRAPGNRAPQH
jgi:integrase